MLTLQDPRPTDTRLLYGAATQFITYTPLRMAASPLGSVTSSNRVATIPEQGFKCCLAAFITRPMKHTTFLTAQEGKRYATNSKMQMNFPKSSVSFSDRRISPGCMPGPCTDQGIEKVQIKHSSMNFTVHACTA